MGKKFQVLLLMVFLFTAALAILSSCGGGGDSGSGAYYGGGGGTTAAPQISSFSNLNSPGQPLRSGDWCQVNGSGFGATRQARGGYAAFTDGINSVQATLYSTWSDTQVVCRVPDSSPSTGVSVIVVTSAGSSSNQVSVPVNPTPNPSPQPTPPTPSPSPSPSVSPSPSPSPSPVTSETWLMKGYAIGRTNGTESGNVLMPEVIKLDNGTYRMFYGHASQAQTDIKYAESPDGSAWTVKSVVLQGTTDVNDREHLISGPSIVKLPDGRYRMYYQASNQPSDNKDYKHHVRSAISTDGINFTKEGIRIEIYPYDQNAYFQLAGHGSYYIASNGTYVGVLSANQKGDNNPSSLYMGTSSDGLTFSNFQKLYTSYHDPIIVKDGSSYVMYATYLLEKQGKAVSTDGITWPAQMTDITMVNSSGTKLTEETYGVGDIGGVLMSAGTIRLYTNYGDSVGSHDIVYFDKQ
ncbi:MAG: hypothetical protein RDV48_25215 [Candidatus Eremiobacteraeota bacterium]|nr:hypothetical protein [Candidatus Eremiobacteraeota bacterium]